MIEVLSRKRIEPLRRVVIQQDDTERSRPMRVLDFDIESRPLGWISQDYVHQEVTAIASAWIVNGKAQDMQVLLLNRRQGSSIRMLKAFKKRYDEADIVTGHYIRGFDLPQLAGAMMEFDLEPLGPKLSHDTKNDLTKASGISKSQENLSSMLGIDAPKVRMNMAMWREANRLTERGLALTYQRCAGDVLQHVLMRQELIRRKWLGPPKVWRP